MRKTLLIALVALSAIIWTVSVQSASTAMPEDCTCVSPDQCDKCPHPCTNPGQCEMKNGQTGTTATATTAAKTSDCGKPCPAGGCAMAEAHK